MFCTKCGKELNENEKCLCQENKKIINNNSDSVDINITALKNKTGKSSVKKLLLLLLVVCIGAIGIIFVSSSSKTVDEPCDWCNNSPSRKYKTSSGVSYVCKECSEECFYCNNDATTHYENMMGMIVFACDECSDQAMGWY